MIKALATSVLLIFICLSVEAQPMRLHYNDGTGGFDTTMIPWGVYELKDTVTQNRYILDSAHIVITALSAGNDTLWQTDPWKDNLKSNFDPYYRMDSGERPIVMLMYLTNPSSYSQYMPWIRSKIPGIAVTFDNSQFGIIIGENGEYKFLGQD